MQPTQSLPEVDLGLFGENWRKMPYEQLKPYWGQHVAWSSDGKHIVAGGPSYDALFQKLDELGIDFQQVVHDYIDPPL